MKKRIILILLCLLLLAGCEPAAVTQTPTPLPVGTPAPTVSAAPEIDFNDFLQQVNKERGELMTGNTPLPDLTPYSPNYADELGTFTREETDLLLTLRPQAEEPVSPAEAAEDVNTLFLMLKTSYGGYHYFGGDEAFLPVRDNVLEALQGRESIGAEELADLLMDGLTPLLRDGHFYIGHRGVAREIAQWVFYVPNLYLTDTEGLDMDYVKPTIGPDGAITYCFAALSRDGEDLPSTMGGYSLAWTPMYSLSAKEEVVFSERERDGVPLLVSRGMAPQDDIPGSTEQLERLSSCGEEYWDKPLFMIDVRRNPGGSSIYSMNWFKGFTGHWPYQRVVSAHKYGDLFRAHDQAWSAETGNPLTLFPADGEWDYNANEGQWNTRAGTIFVLIDRGTASAGEEWAKDMTTVDGVVFVGSNTGGCDTIVGNVTFCLPNTALPVNFGKGLSLAGDGVNRDGVGMLPDLWVPPNDAEDAVLRLIEYYGLK